MSIVAIIDEPIRRPFLLFGKVFDQLRRGGRQRHIAIPQVLIDVLAETSRRGALG